MSNILDPGQAGHFVGPDLGPNCLQRLSATKFLFVCLFVCLLYVPCQQLWSLRDGQFT